jgi:hypothetical protein
MKVMTLKKSQLSYIGGGSYGTYYKIKGRNIGIKVLDGEGWDLVLTADSISELKDSEVWEFTEGEFTNLVKARKITRNVPKPVGLAIIKEYCRFMKTYEYKCGYAMEHIKGEMLDYVDYNDEKLDRLTDRLRKKGLVLVDDHGENTLLTKNRFVFIDAARFQFHKPIKKRKKGRK